MAHSITVRLNKPAREFQGGENIDSTSVLAFSITIARQKRKNGQTTAPLYLPSRERKRITIVAFWLKEAL